MHFIEFDRHLVFSYSDLYTFIGYRKEKGKVFSYAMYPDWCKVKIKRINVFF